MHLLTDVKHVTGKSSSTSLLTSSLFQVETVKKGRVLFLLRDVEAIYKYKQKTELQRCT